MNQRLKKSLVFVMVMAIMMLTLQGCGSESTTVSEEASKEVENQVSNGPVMGGEITVALEEAPETFDIDNTYRFVTTAVTNHVYEGLFEFNLANEAVPQLAESYNIIDDGMTYQIFLRKGVLFQDGEEMNAEDVKASLDRWFDVNPAGTAIKPSLLGVEIVNDYEILVKFDKVYAPFLNILASPVSCQKMTVKKKEIIEKFGTEMITEHIATGPYYFDEIVMGQKAVLKKNENYVPSQAASSGLAGERVAYLDKITFEFVPEESVRIAGLESGQYDFIDGVTTDQYAELENYPNVKPDLSDSGTICVLAFNCGRPVFEDINLRRAVAYGIRPEEMAAAQVGDSRFWTAKDGSWFKEGSVWYDADAGKGIYGSKDSAKAKELIAASKYAGEKIVILGRKSDSYSSNGALTLQSQLKELGLEVEVELFDKSTYMDYLKSGKWDIVISRWSDMSPDPQVYEPWTGTDGWITRWQGEDALRMEEIFSRMVVELDQAKRYEIVKEFYNEFWSSVPYMKVFNDNKIHGISDEVKGYVGHVQPSFWNVWIQE